MQQLDEKEALTRPLAGVRVLDLTWMIAGPNCGRLLADQGAEVIKVESERSIDPGRMAGPWRNGLNTAPDGAGSFTHFNRNKLGITLNLKAVRGRELFLELTKVSDVVVNNYSAGTMARLGLGYADLAAVNPQIVVADLSGLGQVGPQSSFVAFGMTLMAQVGAYELTGERDGPPLMPGYTLADWAGATIGAFAITAALHSRESRGSGQYLDLGQLQMAASLFGEQQLGWLTNGENQTRNGNHEFGPLVHDVFSCLGVDAWCAVVVWPGEVPRLERLTGLSLGENPLPETVHQAVAHWVARRNPQEAMDQLQSAGLEAGAVQDSADLVVKDHHLRARGFFQSVPDVFGETLEMEAVPFIMSRAERRLERTGPMLGGDNDYVFRTVLGLSSDEFRKLRQDGIIP